MGPQETPRLRVSRKEGQDDSVKQTSGIPARDWDLHVARCVFARKTLASSQRRVGNWDGPLCIVHHALSSEAHAHGSRGAHADALRVDVDVGHW
ncbi:hypothetical protein AB1N83_013218 [Pleurotus pulmonarius]